MKKVRSFVEKTSKLIPWTIMREILMFALLAFTTLSVRVQACFASRLLTDQEKRRELESEL